MLTELEHHGKHFRLCCDTCIYCPIVCHVIVRSREYKITAREPEETLYGAHAWSLVQHMRIYVKVTGTMAAPPFVLSVEKI